MEDLGKTKRFMSEVITVSGSTAVGKTATFRELRDLLPDYRFTGGGEFMRKEAEKLGMSIEQFSKHCGTHLEYDRRCDEQLREMSRVNKTVIDTRVPHLFPHAFRVLLKCPVDVSAPRRQREKEYQHLTLDAVTELIMRRDLDNFHRYWTLYPNQLLLDLDYDLILPTDKMAPMDIAAEIRGRHQIWAEELRDRGRLVDKFEEL